MSLVYKRKYEERADGLEKVIGHPVEIRWGPQPKTDGYNIYLPDQPREIWDSDEMVRCGFAHEVAHVMFESDIRHMFDWIETWSNDGNKTDFYDPYGLVEATAESVIQVLEDQRIESLYGEIYEGARQRFRDVEHVRIQQYNMDNIEQDPATALLLMRTSKWHMENDFSSEYNIYPQLKEHWPEYIDVFFEALDNVEKAEHKVTYLMAERVMQEIIGWYRDRIKFTTDQDDIQSLSEDLQEDREEREEKEENLDDLVDKIKELEDDRREAEADDQWDEADKIEKEIEDLREEKEETESELDDIQEDIEAKEEEIDEKSDSQEEATQQLQEIREESEDIQDDLDRDDWEPPEGVMEGDSDIEDDELDESRSEMKRKLDSIRKEMSGSSIPPIQPKENVETEVVQKSSAGVKKAEVYWGIIDDMVREFRRIDGRRRDRLGTSGTEVDVQELIRTETTDPGNTEIMRQEVSEVGFSCTIILDLSMSMIGPKLNTCRNIASTLHECFVRLEDIGFPMDFTLLGYGGHHLENKMMVKECDEPEDTKKITHDPDFGNTPTWHAVNYARQTLKSEDGAKFMILITDGTPTGLHDGGDPVDRGRALSYTRQQVDEAREEGIDMFTLGIGVDLDDHKMREIYGHYENLDDEQSAGRVLLDFVQSKIRDHLLMY